MGTVIGGGETIQAYAAGVPDPGLHVGAAVSPPGDQARGRLYPGLMQILSSF